MTAEREFQVVWSENAVSPNLRHFLWSCVVSVERRRPDDLVEADSTTSAKPLGEVLCEAHRTRKPS